MTACCVLAEQWHTDVIIMFLFLFLNLPCAATLTGSTETLSSSADVSKALLSDILQVSTAATSQFSPPKSYPISPTYFSGKNKESWKLPPLNKSVAVIGDSNLSRIQNSPISSENIQVISLGGAKSQHISKFVDQYSEPFSPEVMILSFGINDRDTHFDSFTKVYLTKIVSTLKVKFPNSLVYIPKFNSHYSMSTSTWSMTLSTRN